MSDKPREFWVAEFEDGKWQVHFRETPEGTMFSDWQGDKVELMNCIHVIEKSAYDELKAKADKLAEALEDLAKRDGKTAFPNPALQNICFEALAEYRGKDEQD